ncbi:MAG: transposase domain-containing protein [Hyphomicrobiaceae bacterium]
MSTASRCRHSEFNSYKISCAAKWRRFGRSRGKPNWGSETAEAIRFGTNHWNGLTCFLGDGRIEIDSNTVERSIRPIALKRKNALFAGSDEGGANWAIVASLIETCKLNGVNPHAWLADTLTKLVNGWPASKIDDLMPWAYAKILA